MSEEIFAQKNEELTCLMFNIKQDLAKKTDPTLKPSHLKEIKYLIHVCDTKVDMSTPFFRDRS